MKRFSTFVAGFALMAATAAPAFAHHPFDAEYDANKPVMLSGTIASVRWADPHVLTTLTVHDANGAMTKWEIELGSPSDLIKSGWTRVMLTNGAAVTIEGWQAKNGAHRANAKSVKFKDDRTLSAASSYDSRGAVATSGKTPSGEK